MRTNPITYKAIQLFLLLLVSNSSIAQLGQKFWFVAPEVTVGHRDEPLVFRITTADKTANITISMPANPGFTTINETIPSHTHNNHSKLTKTLLKIVLQTQFLIKGFILNQIPILLFITKLLPKV